MLYDFLSGTLTCPHQEILFFSPVLVQIQCIGLARLGSESQMIVAGPRKQLLDVDFGEPLRYLIIAGGNHPLEQEKLDFYRLKYGSN